MAEPIGLAAGLLALASFAFESSITLAGEVKSFLNHPKRVRDLIEELEALSGVLGSLAETVGATTVVDLSALKVPLLQCGNACTDFGREITKCTSRSGGSRTSFRDWAKLRYMGEDIDWFRQLLAGYKSTIIIALTDANLRKSIVTAESLESYRDLIDTTTCDLEAHLQNIDEKLESYFGQTVAEPGLDATELRLIKEEQQAAKNCLQICAQLSEHINQINLDLRASDSSPGPLDADLLPERLTMEGLQECKDSLNLTAVKLEGYMKDLIDRLVTKSKTAMTSDDEIADLARLREQWETTLKCRDICTKADTHLRENISTIDNCATGDAVQFMVSTNGKTIRGRNRGLGWRTRQVGGHLNDTSVQQISRDWSGTSFHNVKSHGSPPRDDASSVPDEGVENSTGSKFKGPGFKLTPKGNVDSPVPPKGPAGSRQSDPSNR